MGKTFFGYQLEGLKRQGSDAVWIPLGVFTSHEALADARTSSRDRGDLVDFRECAYYLDDCGPERAVRRPVVTKPTFDDSHLLA